MLLCKRIHCFCCWRGRHISLANVNLPDALGTCSSVAKRGLFAKGIRTDKAARASIFKPRPLVADALFG